MSKICPNCKREIDWNVKFCPFCAAFAGEEEEEKKKSHIGAIIVGAIGVLALGTAAAVFAFGVPGIFGKETETLYGTGDKLFIQSVTPVCIDGKWGYADKDGNTTLKPQYTAAYAFNEDTNDVAPAAVDGKFGYIKKDGGFVASPQYSFAGGFCAKGLARVVDTDGKVGFVDSRGRKAFDGRMFDYASDMNDSGYAFAYDLLMPEIEGGPESGNYYDIIYYLLSSDGKVTELANGTGISAVYDDKYVGSKPNNESGYGCDTEKVYAVFSADGTQLTEYHNYIFKSGNLFIVCDSTDGQSGIYNARLLKADTLDPAGGKYLCTTDAEKYDGGAVLLKRDAEGAIREVLIDDNGNEVFMCSLGSHIVSGFDISGYACVYEKGKYCGYTADGKRFESDCQFGSFNCGLAPYYDNAKIGYINTAGEKLTEARYDGASEYYADGYAYVKSGTEYSVIDTSGNTVIGKLGYASDKLMLADTVHGWYELSDFEGFDGENMFVGNLYYVGKSAEVNLSVYDIYKTKQKKEKMNIESTAPDVEIPVTYRRTDSGSLTADGYLLTRNVAGSTRQLMSPDGEIGERIMENANGIRIGSAPVIRYKDDTATYLEDIFGNRYTVCGYNKISSNDCTVLDLFNKDYTSKQLFVYDDDFLPSFVLYSQNPMSVKSYGNTLYVTNIKYGGNESGNAIIDKGNGRVLYTYDKPQFIGEYFIRSSYGDGKAEISTVYGAKIGAYPYARAYGDRLLCFDYNKYYLFDRYANKLGEYDTMPKISKYNGNIVLKSEKGYTCYDKDFNELLTTRYDIQPIENGYCSFADSEKGMIGFLTADGKAAIEPKYDCVTEMTPDGYFVSKRVSRMVNNINDYTLEVEYAVTIEDKNGESVITKPVNVYDIGNGAFDSKSLYGYFDGYKFYNGKINGKEEPVLSDIGISPEEAEYGTNTDIFGNAILEQYTQGNPYGTDYLTQVNGNMICMAAEYEDSGQVNTILIKLNGERLSFDGRTVKLAGGDHLLGISENNEPAVLYNSDGSVMLTLDGVENPEDITEITAAGNTLLINGYNNATAAYNVSDREVIYKPEREDVDMRFIYENLISCTFLDEEKLTGKTYYVNLDTKKELFTDEYLRFGNDTQGKTPKRTEYPLTCYSYSFSDEQKYAFSYTSVARLDVYELDENMNLKPIKTYLSDDEILYKTDAKELFAYISENENGYNYNIRIINVMNGNERYYENVTEFFADNAGGVWIGVYDENEKRTAYKITADLETVTQVE